MRNVSSVLQTREKYHCLLLKLSSRCLDCTKLYVVVLIKDKLRELPSAAQQCVFLCVHTFYLQLFQASKLSIISKHSMKAPVTFLTFPNEMILCPCDWVGDRDRNTIFKPAGLLSEYYGQRPHAHCVCTFPNARGCAHGAPAECSSLP